MSKTYHQDLYTCEAENSQNKEQPLVRSINLEVKGNCLCVMLCRYFWALQVFKAFQLFGVEKKNEQRTKDRSGLSFHLNGHAIGRLS